MKLDKTSASGASGGILFCEAQLMVEITASPVWDGSETPPQRLWSIQWVDLTCQVALFTPADEGVGPKQFAAQSRPAKGFGWPRWLVIPPCLGKSSVHGLRSAIAILHCCGWDLKQFLEKGMIFGHGCMGKCHDKTCCG